MLLPVVYLSYVQLHVSVKDTSKRERQQGKALAGKGLRPWDAKNSSVDGQGTAWACNELCRVDTLRFFTHQNSASPSTLQFVPVLRGHAV